MCVLCQLLALPLLSWQWVYLTQGMLLPSGSQNEKIYRTEPTCNMNIKLMSIIWNLQLGDCYFILQNCPIYLASPLLGYIIFKELLHLCNPNNHWCLLIDMSCSGHCWLNWNRQVSSMGDLSVYSVVEEDMSSGQAQGSGEGPLTQLVGSWKNPYKHVPTAKS